MNGRWFMILMLGGAAFLPYLVSKQSPVHDSLTAPLKWIGEAPAEPSGTRLAPTDPHYGPSVGDSHAFVNGGAGPAAGKVASPQPRTASRGDAPLVPIEQALRWELTPAWVMSTWPRVTTHLAELDLQGYRMPLVTGTTETDIAGSLTYYFDPQQRLSRITFNGTTGDARRLVTFLSQSHHFLRHLAADDPGLYLYQVEQDKRALSELKIRAAPIVKAGSPYGRFEVSLDMRRPEE
jgi:hypothetical protein